ncbi:hypothetical protein TNCV_2202051 [Trichonephila clavipes]|uniref:Uncharacterized protein n=1 Tax=Trichonephila clavipes TaxID=2585209 RepID=A0A8X6R6L4_TRICX|nr:hypothetical protein TNCV_2202051 [Trichonephila clavipes]
MSVDHRTSSEMQPLRHRRSEVVDPLGRQHLLSGLLLSFEFLGPMSEDKVDNFTSALGCNIFTIQHLQVEVVMVTNSRWSLVYADKPQTLDHLEDNIRRVIADIRPQMLEKVIENWTSRLDYIRASRGSRPMPEIIFKM